MKNEMKQLQMAVNQLAVYLAAKPRCEIDESTVSSIADLQYFLDKVKLAAKADIR